jgi:hypothetical protein
MKATSTNKESGMVKTNPRKLAVCDFDGTLVFTPSPHTIIDGLPALECYDRWLSENNKPKRKFTGFWGRTETLLPPIFGSWNDQQRLVPPKESLNVELAETISRYTEDPDCLTVLMTGRHVGMKHTYLGKKQHVCQSIADEYGVHFDRYYYGSSGLPTIKFKLNVIDMMLREFASLRDVEVWEDRHPHTSEFWNFIKYYKKQGKLDEGMVHQIENQFEDMPETT